MVIQVKFASWDKIYEFREWVGNRPIKAGEFKEGDCVIVKTELGLDFGQVIKIKETDLEEISPSQGLRIVLRKATLEDIEKNTRRQKGKDEALSRANEVIKKYNLPMKLVDVLFHFDGGRITFAFSAPTRIDFRDLVKDLSAIFHKSIRMYQIGARQEVVFSKGNIGPCGQIVCCSRFLKEIQSVSTDLISDQQLTHRGIDRMLGVCGRLKCCLLYEEELYKKLAETLPAIGSEVETEHGKGKIVDRHLLKESLVVEMENGAVVEVSLKDVKLLNK